MDVDVNKQYNVHFYIGAQTFCVTNVNGQTVKEFFRIFNNELRHDRGLVFLNRLGICVEKVDAIEYTEIKVS